MNQRLPRGREHLHFPFWEKSFVEELPEATMMEGKSREGGWEEGSKRGGRQVMWSLRGWKDLQ